MSKTFEDVKAKVRAALTPRPLGYAERSFFERTCESLLGRKPSDEERQWFEQAFGRPDF